MHAVTKAYPVEKVTHVLAITVFHFAAYLQGKGNIFKCGQMVEQTEILKYHADLAADNRHLLWLDGGGFLAKNPDKPARRTQRQEH